MSTLGVLGVFGVGAGSASATPETASDTGTIVFNGTAGVTPSIPPAPATGGAGTFTFNGNCDQTPTTGSSWTSDPGLASETGTCTTIAASGAYTNVVCGTGVATGTATVTLTQPGGDGTEGPVTVRFVIVFVAGNGTLTITGGTWDDDPTVTGSGTVTLTNLPGQSCVGPGPAVTGFNISGRVAVAAAGGPDGPVS